MLKLFMTSILASLVALALPAKADNYGSFKAAHVAADGAVVDDQAVTAGGAGIVHSEGQSYAMLLAVKNGDRATFDLTWNFAKEHLRRDDRLFAWKMEGGKVTDTNNASDAEIVMAWSLIEASRIWKGSYAAEASELVALIRSKLIVAAADPVLDGQQLLLILPGSHGFVGENGTTLNPSYWVFPALEAFAKFDDAIFWNEVIRSGERLIALSSARGLTPDWLSYPTLMPAAGLSYRASYDALRVPLWMAWSGRASPTFAAWRQLWRERQSAWVDTQTGELAGYGPGPEQLSVLALLDRLAGEQAGTLDAMPVIGLRTPYYASAITQLARIAWKERFAE